MGALLIRKAVEKDMNAVIKLIGELADFEHGLHEVTMTEDELIRHGFGENPLFHCLVAESEGNILGTAIYYFSFSTWNGKSLYLEDLIVTRKERSKGVGKGLMKEVIKIARDTGCNRCSWQVLEWNMDARDFYKKIGATLDGEWLNGRLNQKQLKSINL